MKMLTLIALTTLLGAQAQADWGHPPPPPGWDHGMCSVTFKKCDIEIGGFCARWNNKGFQVPYHEAGWACQRAEHEYGKIRDCNVSCH